MPDVYIAEGHGLRPDGTFDPGATDGTHTEQRDSKPVAEACTQVLRDYGLDVISESDMADDPNFYGTTRAANEAGVKCVVSFHYDWNQAPPGAFAIWGTTEGRRLGEAIEQRVEAAGLDIRDYPGNPRSLYLLNNSHAPAVIFECGRIGHEDIDDPDEQRAMGEAAARGILDWLGEDDMPLSESDVDRVATAVVSRVLTDSANYADPPGLGRQIQLIRANVNATLKAVNNLNEVDSAQLAQDIAAELETEGIPKATADLIAARLAG